MEIITNFNCWTVFHCTLYKQVAAPIFEHMYSAWACALERSQLRQEFYGDMYKQDKESNVNSLDDIFQKTPTMKEAILSAVKANMSRILDKSVSATLLSVKLKLKLSLYLIKHHTMKMYRWMAMHS